jgi:hypothetical protein
VRHERAPRRRPPAGVPPVLTGEGPERLGGIVVTRVPVRVQEAPERALVTLSALRDMASAYLLDGQTLYVGDDASGRPVVYTIVDWSERDRALVVARNHDQEDAPPSSPREPARSGLCANRAEHAPHLVTEGSLAPYWCHADQSRRLPGAAERGKRDAEFARRLAEGVRMKYRPVGEWRVIADPQRDDVLHWAPFEPHTADSAPLSACMRFLEASDLLEGYAIVQALAGRGWCSVCARALDETLGRD